MRDGYGGGLRAWRALARRWRWRRRHQFCLTCLTLSGCDSLARTFGDVVAALGIGFTLLMLLGWLGLRLAYRREWTPQARLQALASFLRPPDPPRWSLWMAGPALFGTVWWLARWLEGIRP